MQLGSPAEPNIYLMSDRNPNSEPKPKGRGDSPQLPGMDTIVARNQQHSSEQGCKEQGMKPLLFKDQMSMEHDEFNLDVSLRNCAELSGRLKGGPVEPACWRNVLE